MRQDSMKHRTAKAANLLVAVVLGLCTVIGSPKEALAAAKSALPAGPFTSCTTQADIPSAECDALVALYNSTAGSAWYDHTDWLLTDTPCSWYGIICGGGHVTEIHLWGNNLDGTVPTALASLTALTDINLGNNWLTGTIPPIIGSMTSLQFLGLQQNFLTGTIPTELSNLTNLTGLYLWDNELTGTIPPELGSLTKIVDFTLGGNYLTGPIPPELGNLVNVESFQIQMNQLTGPIPTEVSNFQHVTAFFVSSNLLTGSIPKELGSLTTLHMLSLGSNQLTGTVPAELGNLTNLTWLTFNNNQLSGHLPTSLKNLTAVTKFYYGGNALCEPLAPDFQLWLSGISDRTLPGTKCTPLILVPGIAGSVLKDSGNQELWPHLDSYTCSGMDGDLTRLSLRYDSTTQKYVDEYLPVTPTDIFRKEDATCLGVTLATIDGYHTTIEAFKAAGYEENADLFVYPYDWRHDVVTAGTGLGTLIDQVRSQTGAEKVDIFAHSMGGLVARVAMADPANFGKIRKTLTLGTPVLGAPKALGILEYASPCFADPQPVIGCPLYPYTLQDAIKNAQGVYDILPSPLYDQSGERAPLNLQWDKNRDGKVDGPQYYAGWSAIAGLDQNTDLLQKSKQFHLDFDNIGPFDSSVQYVVVTANGIPTVDRIEERGYWEPGSGRPIFWDLPKWDTLGDGTVPFYSASLYNPATGLNIRNGAVVPAPYTGVEHGDLVKSTTVLSDAMSFFSSDDSSYPRAAAPADVALTGTTTGTEIAVNGPTGGYIEDSLGNRSGQDETTGGLVSLNIPGSHFFALGETQSYFLESADSYQAALNSTGSGTSWIEVSNYAGGEVQQQALFDVDVSADTQMALAFSSGQAVSELQLAIDADGDGTFETTQPPTETLYTVSGHVSAKGVVLTYESMGTQTVTSDAFGYYSFTVPAGWSGTVTPTKAGHTFSPASRSYANISGPQANQDFTPKASIISGANYDGWVLESSETSGKGGTLNKTATTLRVGDDSSRKQYRSVLSFGTGATLPDNAVISTVTLKVKKQVIVGASTPFTVFQGIYLDVMKGTFNASALEAKDFQTTAAASQLKTFGPFKPTPNASGWYTITLPATAYPYINRLSTGSGMTQIRLRFKVDDNNNALADYLSLFSGNATAADRPQLIVQYHLP